MEAVIVSAFLVDPRKEISLKIDSKPHFLLRVIKKKRAHLVVPERKSVFLYQERSFNLFKQ